MPAPHQTAELLGQRRETFLIGRQAILEALERPGRNQREQAADIEQHKGDHEQRAPFRHPFATHPGQRRGGDDRDEDGEQDRRQQRRGGLQQGHDQRDGAGDDQTARGRTEGG
jgi:hypothetical protein